MTAVERRDLEGDKTSTLWLRMKNKQCYEDLAFYMVKIPVSEHKKVKVIEARKKMLGNLLKYRVFEKVEDNSQERISSIWVIIKKEKSDKQKTDYNGKVVAQEFQGKSAE